MSRIKVITEGRDTIFDVFEFPSRSLPFHAYSSAHGVKAEFVQTDWNSNDLARIKRRLAARRFGRSGEQKGRVLYVVGWTGLPLRLEVVATALLHLPRARKPLEVIDISFANRLNVDDRSITAALLLRCAKRLAVSSRQAGGKLHWLVPAKDAGKLASQFEFQVGARKRDRRILVSDPASRLARP